MGKGILVPRHQWLPRREEAQLGSTATRFSPGDKVWILFPSFRKTKVIQCSHPASNLTAMLLNDFTASLSTWVVLLLPSSILVLWSRMKDFSALERHFE